MTGSFLLGLIWCGCSGRRQSARLAGLRSHTDRPPRNVFGTAVRNRDLDRMPEAPVRLGTSTDAIAIAGSRVGRIPTSHGDPPTTDHRERLWDRASEIATARLEIFPGKKFSIFDDPTARTAFHLGPLRSPCADCHNALDRTK
jgi:hypothetical protein